MKRTLIAYLFAFLGISTLWANDGVYFTSGSFLVPTKETDISVVKEILTITIGKDSMARVDVYYELKNNGQPKTVTMAFEAEPPYNVGDPINKKGIHPFIKDFSVVMNHRKLSSRNALVVAHFPFENKNGNSDFTPLDMTKWKGLGEAPDSLVPYENALYNAELDSVTGYAYAYYFDAPFKQGLNIVHHTYTYRMSYSIGKSFEIPYWLTPATRWANHQIDDFTLRITADDLTEFCLADSLFRSAPFKKTLPQRGMLYNITSEYGEPMLFASVCEGDTVTWHSNNFRPTANICISSPEWDKNNAYYTHRRQAKVVIDKQGNESRYLADCGDSYLVEVQDYALVKKSKSHIKEYSAEKGNGFLVLEEDVVKTRVNVRQRPSEKSKKIGSIACHPGEIPEVFPCLGYVYEKDKGYWFKLKINGKIGYVAEQFMIWDAINSY